MISALINIFRKEYLHIIRDRSTFLLALITPVISSIALSFILSTDVRTVKVVAVVPHHSEASRSLISRFQNNPLFRFEGYVDDLSEAENLMKTNKINAAVVLRPDYDELVERIKGGDTDCPSPVQIATDASNCAMGSAAGLYIKAAISEEFRENDEYFSDRILYNPSLSSSYSFQPGIIALVVMLIGLILTSSSFVGEKEFGTIDAVTLSPVGNAAYYVGKSVPYFFLCLIVGILTTVTGIIVTGIPVKGSIFMIFLVTSLYSLTSVLLGILISMFSSKQVNAFAICWGGIIMPVIYCGGIFVPVENLPLWAQNISGLVYARWYVDALRKLMIQGVDAVYVIKEIIYMSFSTVVFLIACHLKIKVQNR